MRWGAGEVEGKAAGFGGAGRGSLGVLRARGVGLLPGEGIRGSGVGREESFWGTGAGCGKE